MKFIAIKILIIMLLFEFEIKKNLLQNKKYFKDE